jgi:hypothetical protein
MAVVSAGSLCAGAAELPTGVHRQYNIIEIAEDFRSVRVHVRAMAVANLFSRGQFMDLGGGSFIDLDWEPPRNLVGAPIDTKAARARMTIEEAESESKSGNPQRAIELLNGLDLPLGSYQRQLFLAAAVEAQDWSAILRVTELPATIEELVRRVEAYNRSGKSAEAIDTLERFSRQLQLPESLEIELRQRIIAQEALTR